MTNLSADAKSVSGIIEEIEGYNSMISVLEYKICDVPDEELEEDRDDLRDEQKRLQNLVNTMTNGSYGQSRLRCCEVGRG